MSIKEFWEDQHTQNTRTWLTGTSLDQILKAYDLTKESLANIKCLEIGVGLVTVTEPLSKLVATLYCTDISDKALTKAGPYTSGAWHTQQIDQIPPVDMAICHLVMTHCDDKECERILRSINLLPGGKIYCQFSCLKSADALENVSHKIRHQLIDSGMHFFRTEEEIQHLCDVAGLQIVKSKYFDPGSYHGWNGQYWQFYQLERA